MTTGIIPIQKKIFELDICAGRKLKVTTKYNSFVVEITSLIEETIVDKDEEGNIVDISSGTAENGRFPMGTYEQFATTDGETPVGVLYSPLDGWYWYDHDSEDYIKCKLIEQVN